MSRFERQARRKGVVEQKRRDRKTLKRFRAQFPPGEHGDELATAAGITQMGYELPDEKKHLLAELHETYPDALTKDRW